MLREHSSIVSTVIRLPFVIKISVLSIFDWPLKTGFTYTFFNPVCVQVSLTRGTMGWFVLCECGISWSCSFVCIDARGLKLDFFLSVSPKGKYESGIKHITLYTGVREGKKIMN